MNIHNVSNGNLKMLHKLYDVKDTTVFTGSYYDMQCLIKVVQISSRYSIPAKVIREISALTKLKNDNIVKLYSVMFDLVKPTLVNSTSCDSLVNNQINNNQINNNQINNNQIIGNIYIILELGTYDMTNMCLSFHHKKYAIYNILSGLEYLEKNYYIHGDVSFKNVVIFDHVFKLVDFGSCIKVYRVNALRKPTVYISPPELMHHDIIYLHKIDPWSAGCLINLLHNDLLNNDISDTHFIDNINNNVNTTLLNKNPCDRLTITEFNKLKKHNDTCNKKHNDTCNEKHSLANKNKISTLENNITSLQFERQKLQIIFELLRMNINNNFSHENIFLTIENLKKLKCHSSDDYYISGYILYYITTKLVSNIEFNMFEMLTFINSKQINNKIRSIYELNTLMLNILFTLNWNIDVDTQFSLIVNIDDKYKSVYSILSLIMLRDKYISLFSQSFIFNILNTIIDHYVPDNLSTYKILCKLVHYKTHILRDPIFSNSYTNNHVIFKIIKNIENVINKKTQFDEILFNHLVNLSDIADRDK